MTTLPSSWCSSSIGQIADVQMGQSPESKTYNEQANGLPFFQGKAEFGAKYPTPRKWCSEPIRIASAGDILLSVRAPVGPTNIAMEECCIGRGLASIRAHDSIDQRYLLHYFRNIEPWLAQQGTGSTFAAINGAFIREIEVPVAPLAEQRRIADKLDALLARVDACRDRLDRIPSILKRFRQAILTTAFSGGLTKSYRTEIQNLLIAEAVLGTDSVALQPTESSAEGERLSEKSVLPDGWVWTTTGQIANCIVPNRDKPKTFSGDIPWITLPDFGPWHNTVIESSISGLGLTIEEIKTYKAKIIPKDSVVMSCIGRFGLAAILKQDCVVNQQIHAFLPSEHYHPKYLAYAIMAQAETLIQSASATTIAYMNKEKCNSIIIPVAPLKEQRRIADIIDGMFAQANLIEASAASSRSVLDELERSILSKAFRGELVPQDPNDEPASILLDRLRAEQAETVVPKAKRGRKPRTLTEAT